MMPPRWRFRMLFLPVAISHQLSVGFTVAYQRNTLNAWRGVLITVFVTTVHVGWHYSQKEG